MSTYEVGEVPRKSSDYPQLLNEVADAPDPLYFLGNYENLVGVNKLAVVGSRAVTMYGEWVVKTIVKEVARCGVTIVSGFMYGVDALAHQAALDVGGKTVAVMAGGVQNVMPRYQADLYNRIVSSGVVVSEYKGSGVGGKWMFAKRNRIVAGLSHAVLVVEAAESSGSLITAGYAKQYGRQLLAVPGNLTSANSYGTTQLLKDGATLVSCADDVLQLFYKDVNYRENYYCALNKRLLTSEDTDSHLILTTLRLEALSADELSRKLTVPLAEVLKCLTNLSVADTVTEREGRYYAN